MIKIQEKLSPVFVVFYTWIVTVFFGAALLDIIYSRLVPDATEAFSEVSDILLLLGTVTFLAAFGAISFSWKFTLSRNYFLTSLAILLLEFLTPVFFSQFISDSQGSGLATTIRILINGAASILALIGLHNFYHQR